MIFNFMGIKKLLLKCVSWALLSHLYFMELALFEKMFVFSVLLSDLKISFFPNFFVIDTILINFISQHSIYINLKIFQRIIMHIKVIHIFTKIS